eukprot:m.9393 g.9393  ORF g.9393 m.9393 type:complete len:441 (+) comp4058_c0_seq1:195-1517(+)
MSDLDSNGNSEDHGACKGEVEAEWREWGESRDGGDMNITNPNWDQEAPGQKPQAVDVDNIPALFASTFPDDLEASASHEKITADSHTHLLDTSVGFEMPEFSWDASMLRMLLNAQIGVATPRYADDRPRKFKFYSRHLSPSVSFDNDEEEEDLNTSDLHFFGTQDSAASGLVQRAAASIRDGLVYGVTATSGAATKTVRLTAGSVSTIKYLVRRNKKQEGGEEEAKDISGLESVASVEELEFLSNEELDVLRAIIGIDGNLSPATEEGSLNAEAPKEVDPGALQEAKTVFERFKTMRDALCEEEKELKMQDGWIEIERKENEEYPEEDEARAPLSVGDDAFSKEMKENGLRHVGAKGETRLWHHQLPPELDVFQLGDFQIDGETDEKQDQNEDESGVISGASTPPIQLPQEVSIEHETEEAKGISILVEEKGKGAQDSDV